MSVSQLLKYRYTSVFFSVYCVYCLWQLSLCGYTPSKYHYCGVKITLTFSWRFLKSVTILCGWVLPSLGGDQPLLGGEFCLGGVDPRWVKAGIPKKGL